jgi:hypothetical protein
LDLRGAEWRESSYGSEDGGSCIEVAVVSGSKEGSDRVIAMRNGKALSPVRRGQRSRMRCTRPAIALITRSGSSLCSMCPELRATTWTLSADSAASSRCNPSHAG